MEKARDNPTMALEQQFKSNKEVILEAQRDKKKVYFVTLGHMSWNQNYRSTKAESCSGETL